MKSSAENTQLLLEILSNEVMWHSIIKDRHTFFDPPIFAAIRQMKAHVMSDNFNYSTLKQIAEQYTNSYSHSVHNPDLSQQFLKAIIDAPSLNKLNDWIINFQDTQNRTWNQLKEKMPPRGGELLECLKQRPLNPKEAEELKDYLLHPLGR